MLYWRKTSKLGLVEVSGSGRLFTSQQLENLCQCSGGQNRLVSVAAFDD